METQTNQRPASANATPSNSHSQTAPTQTPKPPSHAPANTISQATSQPPQPQDPQAAILAELRALRSSIDKGFGDLMEELEADEPAEPTLGTPASTSKPQSPSGASHSRGADDVGSPSTKTATASDQTNGSVSVQANPSEHRPVEKDEHRRQRHESREDWLDRLRNLPPIGPARRRMHESKAVYDARRHDGTKSMN